MIDYIVDNAIFSAGNMAFRQVIGIPMGTDPAPFMANLYLFYYEFHFMKSLESTDYGLARRHYTHTRRFLDDLATLNNNKPDLNQTRWEPSWAFSESVMKMLHGKITVIMKTGEDGPSYPIKLESCVFGR